VKILELRTILDFLGSIKGVSRFFKNDGSKADSSQDEIFKALTTNYRNMSQSIKNRAKNLIAQFPMLYSDNITSNTLIMLNRSFEYQYASLLNLIFNDENIESFKSGAEFLRQYHQNMSGTPYLARSGAGDMVAKGDFHFRTHEGLIPRLKGLKMNYEDITVQNIYDTCKELTESLDERFNSIILDNATLPQVCIEINNEEQEFFSVEEAATSGKPTNNKSNNKSVNNEKYGVSNIANTDIKKVNDMLPTIINVEVNYVGKDEKTNVKRKLSFGVKCTAHIILSKDIEYYLPNLVKNNSWLLRLVKFTTGETSFFKDFLFNIDEIKNLAKDNNNTSFWWRKLHTIASTSKMSGFFKSSRKNYKPIPITTMVISKENCDNIKNSTGLDLLHQPKFAMKIFKYYYLLSLVIVDESTELVYILNEATGDYDTYPCDTFKSHNKNKIDLKDLYNVLK